MRKKRTRADLQAKVKARRDPGHRRRGRETRPQSSLDPTELVTLVCKYFCAGHPPSEIEDLIWREHKIRINREYPYRCLSDAASRQWIRFVAPHEHTLREWVSGRYDWLDSVDVVHTAVFDDVAYHAAEMLVDLLRTHCRPPYNKRTVHVGFAGGHAMRKVAQILAELLRRPMENLPETVFFHALVAGFDVEDPTTDPNAFFTYFVSDPAIQVEARFVALHAPPIVETTELPRIKALDGIREAFERAQELDVIVTSAAGWSGPCTHSMLRKHMTKSPESLRKLENAGCQCDMLWRPLARGGPIEIDTEIRAMTLMELSDFSEFIKTGKHVLLVIGPCGRCNRPKRETLETILGLEERLITHLVVDSRSANALLKAREGER